VHLSEVFEYLSQIMTSEVRKHTRQIFANYVQIEIFFNKTTFTIDKIT